MARYNQKRPTNTTQAKTYEGGTGYKFDANPNDPRLEFINLLAHGVENTFYESGSEKESRLTTLIETLSTKDVDFIAKALIYARTVLGQRSITHIGAAVLAKFLSGSNLGSRFFSKRSRGKNEGGIIYRLDDMLEIAAAYMTLNPNKPLSNGIKKGFKIALENADEYELAKYQGKTRSISLIDLVNLVHPKPSEKMKPVFEKLMKGELKQFNTVEDKNSKAGQIVAQQVKEGTLSAQEAEEKVRDMKGENFADLISNRKIGYLALIRNLRNILNTSLSPNTVTDMCNLLTDEIFIKKSLVFPHQIDLALEVLLQDSSALLTSKVKQQIIQALNTAYELSIPNLKELFPEGRTAVVYDSSGSMTTKIRTSTGVGSKSAIEKAALIAATLAKGVSCDVYTFSDTCSLMTGYNTGDSINTLKAYFLSKAMGSATYFSSIFNTFTTLNKAYDRVIIVSDMQGADEVRSPLKSYSNHVGINPYIYCINLCGYSTTMVSGPKVYQLHGYTSEIYEIMKRVEFDPRAVLNDIEAIVI
jgi:hypothetical protein